MEKRQILGQTWRQTQVYVTSVGCWTYANRAEIPTGIPGSNLQLLRRITFLFFDAIAFSYLSVEPLQIINSTSPKQNSWGPNRIFTFSHKSWIFYEIWYETFAIGCCASGTSFLAWPVECIAYDLHLLLARQHWICQGKGHLHAAASLIVHCDNFVLGSTIPKVTPNIQF